MREKNNGKLMKIIYMKWMKKQEKKWWWRRWKILNKNTLKIKKIKKQQNQNVFFLFISSSL